jgi:hypothetical protein
MTAMMSGIGSAAAGMAGSAGPGFFSPGGVLDKMVSAGNPTMADSDLPPWLKALMTTKVAYSGGNGKSFAIGGMGGRNQGMTPEEVFALADRLSKKFSGVNEAPVSSIGNDVAVKAEDYTVPSVGAPSMFNPMSMR